ncbi:hypothetical protein IPC139_28825 [Pseudomonas aeruginosa]|uniref:hypothetical protein n=1 Tax=Pseudomonas aeruginosa TaxID=287 RepID=UPI0010682448|nr:hypothetical protein [Pseudomonas aeruginosa]TEN50263.1 hypothetical protein IPC140_29215 [Pseudomonas aeruginosa]TEN69772.1 hypothetical protein IPC139_28825 [Pseudomonas aeruginosa]
MLIKLPDFDDDLAERLKSRTGQNTGSKAVLRAAEEYLPLLLKLEHRDRQIAELEERLRVASQVIEGARSAAALLLEKTAQGDLLAAPASSKPRMTGEEMLNELRRSAGFRQR